MKIEAPAKERGKLLPAADEGIRAPCPYPARGYEYERVLAAAIDGRLGRRYCNEQHVRFCSRKIVAGEGTCAPVRGNHAHDTAEIKKERTSRRIKA